MRQLTSVHELELELQRQGFKHDVRDDAPICRFASGSVTLDVVLKRFRAMARAGKPK